MAIIILARLGNVPYRQVELSFYPGKDTAQRFDK